jgi:copper homeostasis protein (lipoprotein)
MPYLRSMTVWKYLAACTLLTVVACNYRNPDQIVVYDTIPGPVEIPNGNISSPEMKYSGKLPCADCGGIETVLTFIPDSMIYRMSETYLNTGDGDKTFESTGTYAMNRGTVQDSGAIVFQLNPGDSEKTRAFKEVGDNSILMLDRNFNEINSSLNYYLVKVVDSLAVQ